MQTPRFMPTITIAFAAVATTTLVEAQQLVISSGNGSQIQFVGSKPDGQHAGGFRSFTGTFDAGAGTLSLSIDMKSLYSDNQKLTGHLMSPDFFDVRKFSTATFASTAIRKQQGQGSTHVIEGRLTIRGTAQQISIPCTIDWQGKSIITAGRIALQRSAFGITYGAGKINEQVPVTFSLTGKPAAP